MKAWKHKVMVVSLAVASACASAATYPSAGNGTDPNVWTRNYSGVIKAAKTTGYPVFLIVVNSAGCGHCSAMMDKTVHSAEFQKMESELTFYKVIMDEAYSGASSDYRTCITRYKGYLDYSMYPAVVVLRKDGSAYGGFGNRNTDKRNVTADIRKMIEAVATEQGSDIWSGSGVVPDTSAVVPPAEVPVGPLSAAAWAVKLKGKAAGVAFSAEQALVATCIIKVAANGKVNAKLTSADGKETAKGVLSISEAGEPSVVSDGLDIRYDESLGVWRGTWGGRMVFASASSSADYDGTYTSGAASGGKAGYFSVAVKRKKGKISGVVNGKNKVSASGDGITLPALLVAEQLGNWDIGEDLTFIPAIKRGVVSGGVAVSKSGVAHGFVTALGSEWELSGAKWPSTASLATLDGMVLSISGLDVEVPLLVEGANKVVAGVNAYMAKVKVTARTGAFKGSVKVDGVKLSFSGVLVADDASIVGQGVANGKGAAYPVLIGSPCGSSCSATL